jgi:two-component system sensor histidine kinase MtrB
VAETERELIFQRFSRGSQGGRRGQGTGSGLGLALVAEHVRLHGGQVWAEDRTDGRSGSRFVVSLPIGTEAQDHEDLA